MSDLVERLRAGIENCGDRCKVREAKSGCECAEAADEIERLRAEVISLRTQLLTLQLQRTP